MLIKELKKTVNVSWSPAEQYPIYLAAGSSAQQLDATFSSTSHLEIYSLNLEDPGLDLGLKASLQTQHKFHKLVWSGAGILVGGCDAGLLEFYNSEKLLDGASDALIGSSSKHNGNVSALDINPFQKNLLASGASESEIFIWDLNNTSQPMAPGNKSQPFEHVQGLAWNRQVQHILGSTFASRCVVWDLRKNEPIMKLSDPSGRGRWRGLAWHGAVATQLVTASDDDQLPVIQLWDLRLAASPLVTLEGHHKGVMSVSWSSQDPDLLLSAGKDGRVLCWNPNNTRPGGELLSEIVSHGSWVFEASWCPRDPQLLAASADTQLVHSLLGGARPDTTPQSQSTILDSFGAASLGQLPAVARAQAQPRHEPPLPRAPKWMKRPAAAKFAFGGKLVTFEKCPQEAGSQKLVHISQVVSDPAILERAADLESILLACQRNDPAAAETLAEYCRAKGDAAAEQAERYTWFFLRANFLPDFRTEVLNLLGFKQDDSAKLKSAALDGASDANVDSITSGIAGLSRGESTETEAELSTDTSTDLSDAHTLIERKLASVENPPNVQNVNIPNGDDAASAICRALVCGQLADAVLHCLEARRVADALLIASLGSPELVSQVQQYHLNSTAADPVSLLGGALLLGNWGSLVQGSRPAAWRHVLAALVTHCAPQDAAVHCEQLGDRLSQLAQSDPSLALGASIAYLCAGAPRLPATGTGDVTKLAPLVEKAAIGRKAAEYRGRRQSTAKLDSVLEAYASALAGQGALGAALAALQGAPHCELGARLGAALGTTHAHQPQQQTRARTTSSHSQTRAARNDYGYNNAPQSYEAPKPWPPAPPAPAAPAPAQPPRPPSTGPQPAGGITGRSKYKVDPSVQSARLYDQYSFNTTPSAFNATQTAFNTAQPGFNATQPGFNATQPGYNSQYQPLNAANDPYAPRQGFNNPAANPMAPINTTPINPINPLNPTPLNPITPLNPTNGVNGNYFTPSAQEPAAPAPASKPVPPGWNDPPMMTSKPKPKQDPATAPAPITHPLFGAEPPQHIPLAPDQYNQYPGQQQYPGQYPGQQQYPGQGYGGQQQYPGQQQFGGQQQYNAPPNAYPPKVSSPAPSPAPAPVPKAPLPEQHAALQSVFDAIHEECSLKATNPQIKRKLEDVHRRLETLYDMLREYRLSEAALGSLHAASQYAAAGDYDTAAQAAAALAAGADFAAAASFLPGLKVLFQLAQQNSVYVR